MTLENNSLQLNDGSITAESLLVGQREVLELIARGASLHDSLGAIARFAERHIPGMSASILYFDPSEKKLRRGGYGKLPSSFADIVDGLVPGPKAGSCGTCAWRGERVISEDVFLDPLWDGFHDLCRTYDIRSAWSSPLLSSHDGSLLGVFGMYHPEVREPSSADLQIVDQFTQLATIAAQRHRMDEEYRYRSNYDVLTNLRNRYGLLAEADRLIKDHISRCSPLCLALVDLDSFKSFNDVFGYLDGDKLLRNVSDSMQAIMKDGLLLTRLGGNEFALFLPANTDNAVERLHVLRTAMAQGVSVAGHNVPVNFSAALVEITPEFSTVDKLLSEAYAFMEEAKVLGGGRTIVVDSERSARAAARRGLAKRIESALDEFRLHPHAQPIVALGSEQVIGYELLCRFNDSSLSNIPIIECIAEAERVGLIQRLGLMMFQAGVDFLARPANLLSQVYVSINVSVRQLLQPDLPHVFSNIARAAGVATNRIYLEVTESAAIEPGGLAHHAIKELKSAGFKLSVDDFGTGYASLAHLQLLPFDVLKIDRQFVMKLGQTDITHAKRASLLGTLMPDLRMEKVSKDQAMCGALISMAKVTDMLVVAEGVETQQQADILRRLGCQMGQGYLWSKPKPLESIR